MRQLLTVLAVYGAFAVLTAQVQVPPFQTNPNPVTVTPLPTSVPFVSAGTSPALTGSLRIPNGNTQFNALNAAGNTDVPLINLSATDVLRIGSALAASTSFNTPIVSFATTLFAALGTPANGTFQYCSDCTIANPCAGAGTGAFAKRLNGVWVCN